MNIAPAHQNKQSLSWFWLFLLGLALLLSGGFFGGFALPYLLLDYQVLERFAGRSVWILLHIIAGSLALFIGPFQLWMGLQRKKLPLHRLIGKIYLLSIAVSSICALYLSVTNEISLVFGAGLGGLACAWIITTGVAYVAIRQRHFMQHQEWMIRSYVVTLAFVIFRIFVGISEALEIGTLFQRLELASWFCWAVPLLVTEAVIQGRKVFQKPGTA